MSATPLVEAAGRSAVTLAVPCKSDEPSVARTLEALWMCARLLEKRGHAVRFSVCVNGMRGSAALEQVERFARTASGAGRTDVLVTERADKATAWNRLRAACDTPWIAFCDADVEPAPEALVHLAEALESRPEAIVATARLEPDLAGAGWVARAAALPHRFDLGVVRGPLYLMRSSAVLRMPEGLLLEDGWLSAEIGSRGPGAVLSVWSAVVRYRPAATLADYFRERLRTEAGKIQIRAERRRRGVPNGPIARYPWEWMLRSVGPREWPLAALNLGVRGVARVAAEIAAWRGREVAWSTVQTSKSSAPSGK